MKELLRRIYNFFMLKQTEIYVFDTFENELKRVFRARWVVIEKNRVTVDCDQYSYREIKNKYDKEGVKKVYALYYLGNIHK